MPQYPELKLENFEKYRLDPYTASHFPDVKFKTLGDKEFIGNVLHTIHKDEFITDVEYSQAARKILDSRETHYIIMIRNDFYECMKNIPKLLAKKRRSVFCIPKHLQIPQYEEEIKTIKVNTIDGKRHSIVLNIEKAKKEAIIKKFKEIS